MRDARIKPAQADRRSGQALLARWIVRGRMTQAEAAEQIGISRVKLNQYLNAVARPSLETAIRIEDVTGIGIRLWLIDEATVTAKGPTVAEETLRGEETEVNNNNATGTQTRVRE